jgi:hypothetical protein
MTLCKPLVKGILKTPLARMLDAGRGGSSSVPCINPSKSLPTILYYQYNLLHCCINNPLNVATHGVFTKTGRLCLKMV